MRVIITTPTDSPHGGVRVILEWANRLSENFSVGLLPLKGHVFGWFGPLSCDVVSSPAGADLLILTSPHDVHLLDYPCKKVLFLQMLEHLFRPHDQAWLKQCMRFYMAPYPMISISAWNIEWLKQAGRPDVEYYVGNGVNFDQFPKEQKDHDNPVVLVEGLQPGNPSKDASRQAWRVARALMREGVTVTGYGMKALHGISINGEYIVKPSLEDMNRLYREASLMLKASIYDARSCAPMEALSKCTPTVRAINKGDDDLRDGFNCVKMRYGNSAAMLKAAKELLSDHERRRQLGINGLSVLPSWEVIMSGIRKIIEHEGSVHSGYGVPGAGVGGDKRGN
ncbi:MAG: glycosyltransferase [Chitinophagales bacterium]|nr:glycosyltransferase [Chitinophagales bacterium]